MQRQRQSIFWVGKGRRRNLFRRQCCPYATGLAKALKIDGKTVADVHHGAGQATTRKELAERALGLGKQVSTKGRLLDACLSMELTHKQAQPKCREAEATADEDPIPNLGAGPPQRLAAWDSSRHDDVRRSRTSDERGVATDHGDGKPPGQGKEAIIETFQPSPSCPPGNREGDQGVPRRSPHGGNIAQRTRQGSMPHGTRRMSLCLKVHVLNRHVGRENQLLPGGNRDQSGIITDAQRQARRPRKSPPANPRDKVCFAFERRLITHKRAAGKSCRIPIHHLSRTEREREEKCCPIAPRGATGF